MSVAATKEVFGDVAVEILPKHEFSSTPRCTECESRVFSGNEEFLYYFSCSCRWRTSLKTSHQTWSLKDSLVTVQ